jgi:hypothetical protein
MEKIDKTCPIELPVEKLSVELRCRPDDQQCNDPEAKQQFCRRGTIDGQPPFSPFFVVNDSQQLIGVSLIEILRGLSRTPNWQTKAVSEIMTPDPTT